MWPYWMLFLVPACGALASDRGAARPAAMPGRLPSAWLAAGVALTLLIGLREQVGGDWITYYDNLENLRGATLADVFSSSEPGYQLASWISLELGWGIYGVNLICGALFTLGLTSFCRMLPRPWLAMTIAIPYLVIVVGMGYTRQGVALGCEMLAVRYLLQHSAMRFIVWAVLGATFHRTAVLLLPLGALTTTRSRYWMATWMMVAGFAAYSLLLSQSVDDLYVNYIEAEYQSQGAFIRLLMNAVPASLLLLRWKRFRFGTQEAAVWRWAAFLSFALLALFFVTPASTALDRLALYLLPLQLVVFSHMPDALGSPRGNNAGWVMAVIVYYALVLVIWLNFAAHAGGWVPYRFYPLDGI